jgi:hypothetical protein
MTDKLTRRRNMKVRTTAILWCIALGSAGLASAQTPTANRVFIDGAIMADRDTGDDGFYGPDLNLAGRGGVGVALSDHNSLRFELDVPSWRTDLARTSVRGISYAFLYGRHLPEVGRLRVALVVGGSIEDRRRRAGTFGNEIGRSWPAAVFGADAEIGLTRHLAVIPQVRFHYFPYPYVAIARPGVAIRWGF